MKKTYFYTELYSLYKAVWVYKRPFQYVYYRYIIAPKIRKWHYSLEKPVTHPDLSIHMLTCHRDATIAAWSLASFYQVSKVIGKLTLHNDGTLTESDTAMFKRLFPNIRIVSVSDFLSHHASELEQYPKLKKFREEYPKFQSKKILDVFFERRGAYVLFLDSDLIWFRDPVEITDAVKNNITDVSYMMSNGIGNPVYVQFKDGTRTSEKVAECNSGALFFHEESYRLSDVEEYVSMCDYMNKKFTDQACFGTVLKNVQILPRDKYFIKGEITDETIMRHFTGPSREKFYFLGICAIYRDILSAEDNKLKALNSK